MRFDSVEHLSDSKYCFALSKDTLKVRLRVSKEDEFQKIECLYNNSQYFYKEALTKEMTKELHDTYFVYYTCTLKIMNNDPRLCYIFKLTTKDGETYYYSEDGFTKDYDFNLSYYNRFGIPYINEIDIRGNKNFNNLLVYQIFPERFKSSDLNKSYITRNWDSLDLKGDNNNRLQNVFLGGDFKGITSKLDYLKDLGVDVVYLTPINESPSNHKYDVVDYFTFDKMFGTKEDFKELVDNIHKRGMKIILDLVFNHSSRFNPMFLDVLMHGKESEYYDFYFMHKEKFKDSNCNYETFGFTQEMPKLNSNNFDEHDYFVEVGKYYIENYGVDGYRLDVADEVSHSFWNYFKHEMKRVKKDIILIGEHWTDSTQYLRANELDSVMNYPFLIASKKYFVDNTYNSKEYSERLNYLLTRYDDNSNSILLNLLDSHDTIRFYEFLKPNINLYLCSVLTLILYPGLSMIYYGNEVFMEGGSDPDNRRGMTWDSPYFKSKEHQLFKDILHLKKDEVIRNGDTKIYSKDDLFIIERSFNGTIVQGIINHSNKDKELNYSDVILSLNYESNILKRDGFIVRKY